MPLSALAMFQLIKCEDTAMYYLHSFSVAAKSDAAKLRHKKNTDVKAASSVNCIKYKALKQHRNCIVLQLVYSTFSFIW